VDTASGGSDWCNGEYSRCECESGGSKNVNLIIYIYHLVFQDILQETIANQSPNATKRVIVSIMEVSSTSLGTGSGPKNAVIARGHRKRDAGIVHWISQMQQLDVIRCIWEISNISNGNIKIYLNISNIYT
jgi:hypothetical protein